MRGGKIALTLVLVLLLAVLAVILRFRLTVEPMPSQSVPAETVTPSPTPAPTDTPSPPETNSSSKFSENTEKEDLYADKPKVDITSWELRLVNADNLLTKDFIPDVSGVEDGQYFDTRAVEALKSFVAGAREAGLSVYVTSSYRSYATQEHLFNNKVNQYTYSEGSYDAAVEKARTIVAYPGSSEHQTGLAADIVDQYYEYMNESLADTALSKWMKENCARYGFILRFPEDKQDITGIMFEPWHFRYVGVEAATYIMEKGLCLEEFVALYQE